MEIKLSSRDPKTFNVITLCKVLRTAILPGLSLRESKDIADKIGDDGYFILTKHNIPPNYTLQEVEANLENQDYFDFMIYMHSQPIVDIFKELMMLVHKENMFGILHDLTGVYSRYFE
jgi:hypothetical protein